MIASGSSGRRPRGTWGRWRARALLAATAGAGLASVLAVGATSAQAASTSTATSAGPARAARPAINQPPPQAGVMPGGTYVGSSLVTAYLQGGEVWVKDLASGNYFDTGAYQSGGALVTGPSVIPSGNDVLVFDVGANHQLYVDSCTLAADCSGWSSLGGDITSKAGAVFQGPNVADYSVYARGTNGAVWGRTHTTAGWGSWEQVGGNLRPGTGPAAADLNGTYILATGTNNELYLAEIGHFGFEPVGGITTASPGLAVTAASSAGQAALVGVARGTDNQGYYHRFLSSSPGWHGMGGTFSTGLSVANEAWTTTTTAFGLGSDSQLYAGTQSWATYPPRLYSWILES
jgi:hypothetical protein